MSRHKPYTPEQLAKKRIRDARYRANHVGVTHKRVRDCLRRYRTTGLLAGEAIWQAIK